MWVSLKDKGADGRFAVLRLAGGRRCRELVGQVRKHRALFFQLSLLAKTSHIRCELRNQGQDHGVRAEADCSHMPL